MCIYIYVYIFGRIFMDIDSNGRGKSGVECNVLTRLFLNRVAVPPGSQIRPQRP